MENELAYATDKLNITEIRKDFPILEQKVYGKKLVYFDNGATTQKPVQVLNALDKYYREYNSNVHRGVHFLSQKATDAHEHARKNVAKYINAQFDHEVVFTRGTTESINLVASSFGKKFLHKGDSILISAMEHHSNIVPWQMICEEKGATLKVIPMDENGILLMDKLPGLLDETVKLVACVYISNSLGTINPIQEIIAQAHAKNIPVLIDAAQAVQHIPVDVQALDADFLVFSGHKLYGPTGIGVLYGKEGWLNKLPPYQGGGEMIKTVTFEKTVFNDLPFKFEAGTPDIAGTIGLSAAIDYITNIGLENIHGAETELLEYALEKLTEIEGLKLVGNSPYRAAVIAFSIKNLHPFDIGELLDKQGIAVRTGHHCTQPIMDFFGIPGTVRVSLAFYNTFEEIDILVAGLKKAIAMLG
jgi:cysteine desulfurase/selenocysteine lyase